MHTGMDIKDILILNNNSQILMNQKTNTSFIAPLFDNQTCYIIASGPSLNDMDLAPLLELQNNIITINTSFRLFPNSRIQFWGDSSWFNSNSIDNDPKWETYGQQLIATHHGEYWITTEMNLKTPYINTTKVPDRKIYTYSETFDRTRTDNGRHGLEFQANHLRGNNSGAQAINLAAVHLKAKNIILLGYDMHYNNANQTHWFGKHVLHVNRAVYESRFIPCLNAQVEDINRLGVNVINCTPNSALQCWPKGNIKNWI